MTAPTRCQTCRERNKTQPRGNNTGQPRQMYAVYCSDCGIQTQVPFQPKQGRSVYCQNCYPAHKRY
jgi:CxxC-x17-CxxC domain-containing protein